MPIYEFACPRCRVVFSFLSKRLNPANKPTCPRCGFEDLEKQITGFAIATRSGETGLEAEPEVHNDSGELRDEFPMPNWDEPKVRRAMKEMERQMPHLDENNPRHLAHLMRKMKDLMPPGSVPSEMEQAIRRLEAGEDLEAVEADMGEALDPGEFVSEAGCGQKPQGYVRDSKLYEY